MAYSTRKCSTRDTIQTRTCIINHHSNKEIRSLTSLCSCLVNKSKHHLTKNFTKELPEKACINPEKPPQEGRISPKSPSKGKQMHSVLSRKSLFKNESEEIYLNDLTLTFYKISRPTCFKISQFGIIESQLKIKRNNNKIQPKVGLRQATQGMCTLKCQNMLK